MRTLVLCIGWGCLACTSQLAPVDPRTTLSSHGSNVLPDCQWPSDADLSMAASPLTCEADRAILNCGTSQGGGGYCLSGDGLQCREVPFDGPCQSGCGANEYGVVCGQIVGDTKLKGGQLPWPAMGCRLENLPTPGGTVQYCCPCGT